MFEGDKTALRKNFNVQNAEEIFSWFLLTSACLSNGAQGKLIDERRGTLSYSNFELGVLFCSRLQGIKATDQVYCWKPSVCYCSYESNTRARTRMVHLPVPYCCRATPYQLDTEEPDFAERPYFHEAIGEDVGKMNVMLPPQENKENKEQMSED